ncbi:MAG: hypothetical protein KC656_23055, partial [Myxococcales bacterium]|nr:hypothetical protein [Myxococcales bacterium]
MNEALTLFREGGPWMYALLVLATGTPFLAVLLTFAAGSRTRTPGCLWTTLALFPLLVGLVATTSLLGTAAGALELASVESRATLAANGFAQALAPLVAGAAASAFTAACIAFAGGLGSLFGARPGGRFTIHHALLAGLAVVSPLGLAFVGAPVGAAVLALAGAGVFVGALRFVRDPASPDAARSAGTRLLVAAMWTLALLGWTLVLVLWDLVDWMGHGASPAVIGPATALTLVALLGVPVVAVTVAPVVKSVSRWTVVNAVLGTLPFFAVVGVGGLVVGPAMQLRQLTIPPEEAREAALAWAGIEVASVK